MKTQYWLVTVDSYGNPTLKDGGHWNVEGANQAMYLYNSLGLCEEGETYAIAKIDILPVVSSYKGVNKEAISVINRSRLQSD